MYFQGRQFGQNSSLLLKKGAYFKSRVRSLLFPFRADPFQKEPGVPESKQEATEFVSFETNSGKSIKCIQSP